MQKSKKSQIAIVGVGFRLPGGVNKLGDLWTVLSAGKNLISEVDHAHFDSQQYQHPSKTELGKSYTFKAGMLPDIHHFDASFFGISPREAMQMDPQQRLLLEVAWEALENGSQNIDALRGKKCAVYVGIGSNEHMFQYVNDTSRCDSHTMIGTCSSIASNRLSYFFNFQGPSMSIDTACSSSLVALHQACESIRSGDASMAIAGGVNLLQSPTSFIGFSKASMLSPDGQCKSFSAKANGYVRSEGCVVFFLKALKDAERDGDPIHAVILNSGVNNDGRTNGIVLPSADAQAALVSQVHNQVGILPDDIAYIEAHGTGTLAGDQAESHGLNKAISKNRMEGNPLLIGSIKSNLGHLEVASGLTGMLKTILCLQHKKIPKTLHFDEPNPNIAFDEMKLKVVDAMTDISHQEKPLIMGVNSFGFGGTNAHVVLREYHPLKNNQKKTPHAKIPPLFLSTQNANNESALLRDMANCIRRFPDRYHDIAHTAFYRKAKHHHGMIVYGETVQDILHTLDDATENNVYSSNIVKQDRLGNDLPLVLVYSGNGAQWQGMGVALIQSDPIFKKTIREIDVLFSKYADFSIKKELLATLEKSRYDQTEIAQPCLFALQVATTRYLLKKGLIISAVVGHSVGEIAASWACGALTLEEATAVIYQRSFWQGKTRGHGRMVAVGMSADAMQTLLQEHHFDCSVSIAAVNSADAVTIAGDFQTLQNIQKICDEKRIFNKLLELDYAFHTNAMDAIKTPLIESLTELRPKSSMITYVSTVTGDALSGEKLTAEYWWDNIRQPVQFHSAIEALIKQGMRIFVEVGPHPVLKHYVEGCLRSQDIAGGVFSTGRRNQDALSELHQGLFKACLSGVFFDSKVFFPFEKEPIELPSYPWLKEFYHLSPSIEDANQVNLKRDHLLLGTRVKKGESIWENHLDTTLVPYLADHIVNDAAVFPAAGFCEMALAAASLQFGQAQYDVRDLEILSPLVFDEFRACQTRFELNQTGDFMIKSRLRHTEEEWRLHVVGRIIPEPALINSAEKMDEPSCYDLEGVMLYDIAKKAGLMYGPLFQSISHLKMTDNYAIATLQLSSEIMSHLPSHHIYPGILDACFQVLIGLLFVNGKNHHAFLPVRIGRLTLHKPLQDNMLISARILKKNKHSVLSDFLITDLTGSVLVSAKACRFKKAHFTDDVKPNIFVTKPHLLKSFPQESFDSNTIAEIQKIQDATFSAVSSSDFHQLTELMPLMDLMVIYFIHHAIRDLSDAQTFSIHSFVAHASISDQKIPFLKWCLTVLEENHLIQMTENEEWTLVPAVNEIDPCDIWQQILSSYPAYITEALYSGRAGAHLKSFLQGNADPLFQKENLHYFFENTPSVSAINANIISVFSNVLVKCYSQKKVRVLDIGASISDLSIQLMNACPCDRTDYVLWVNDDTAKISIENKHYVKTNTFSDEKSWENDLVQFENILSESESFDIVVIRNHLHTVKNISKHIILLKKLLSKNAIVFFLASPGYYFQNVVLGLDDQWWRQSQKGNSVSPLMTSTTWKQLFEENGFSVTHPAFEQGGSDVEGQFLFLAQSMPTLEMSDEVQKERVKKTILCISDNSTDTSELSRKMSDYCVINTLVLPLQFPEEIQPSFFNKALLPYSKEGNAFSIVYYFNTHSLIEATFSSGMIISLLKSLGHLKWIKAPRLILISHHSSSENPAHSVLLGLGRVIQNEYSQFSCKLIDVQGEMTGRLYDNLLTEISIEDAEQDVVITEGGRYGQRVESIYPFSRPASKKHAYFLDFKRSGSLKNLCWSPVSVVPLKADEVRIAPKATGLNFRDLMYAMGLIPDEAVENGFLGATLGMEFSGNVLEVGASVSDFKVGDRVMGFAPASFSTMTVTKAHAITPLPSDWCYEAAATVPIAFFTAYYALHHLARLQPGERVLIHGAAGGVGIAAIQIAKQLGAVIFATAGSAIKQDFLMLSGVDYRYDSRSLRFADEILRDTQGEGVDVVLNCLAGEAIVANLSVIKPFGRFLELGKRDFFANSKMGLRPFRNNISYFGIDADQLLMVNPRLCASLFRGLMENFEKGMLTPLPYCVFETRAMDETFRYMQQSRHIGKVVVKIEEETLLSGLTEPCELSSFTLSENETYLVTGGARGFGLVTAQWLVNKGARHVVLLSRTVAVDNAVSEWIEKSQSEGIIITPYCCDVSDEQAVQTMIRAISNEFPPIKGIIHAAAVYEDGLIQNLDTQKIKTVIDPKALGAWHLHNASLQLNLDFFVVYSSVTTLFGNPGQANYVAANAYLESLIHYRRSLGLSGLFVAWGPIADAGYLARNEKIKDMLSNKLGGQLLTTSEALGFLEKLLLIDISGISIANLNFNKMARSVPVLSTPKFECVIQEALINTVSTNMSEDIRSIIADKSELESITIIGDILLGEIARILRFSVEKMDKKIQLINYGMDSLVGVELAHAIQDRFAIQMPMMSLSQGITVEAIAERIFLQLQNGSDISDSKAATNLNNIESEFIRHGEQISTDMQNVILDQVERMTGVIS